ncbi:MAG: ribosome recycling factor [Rickettsiales bacterium]
MLNDIKNQLKNKLEQTQKSLEEDFSGLRTSKASTKLLERVVVEAYGDKIRLDQVASVTISDKQSLSVQPFDAANLKHIQRGIELADLGVSLQVAAGSIRVSLPMLTEERRRDLTKLASQFGEKAKIAIRNIRREAIDSLKKLEKAGGSEDITKRETAEIEKLIDETNKKIEKKVEEKNKDILSI